MPNRTSLLNSRKWHALVEAGVGIAVTVEGVEDEGEGEDEEDEEVGEEDMAEVGVVDIVVVVEAGTVEVADGKLHSAMCY
jgi:hypothetical protein